MISEDRISAYLESLEEPESPLLEELEEACRKEEVPIIRKETQSFLKVMLTIKKPVQILEIGAGVGFSSILMSEYMPQGAKITTIENWKSRIPKVKENIKKAGKEEVITLLAGDAKDILPALNGPYDFIFLDAAKGQYLSFLPDLLRLLEGEGILLSDNVLQDGDTVESRYAVERRKRTIHDRLREYLYELKHNEELMTSILPLGDGVAVSVKTGEREGA